MACIEDSLMVLALAVSNWLAVLLYSALVALTHSSFRMVKVSWFLRLAASSRSATGTALRGGLLLMEVVNCEIAVSFEGPACRSNVVAKYVASISKR